MTNHDEQMKAVARLVSGRPDWIDAPAVQAWHRSDRRTEHDGTPGKPRIWSPDYKTTETWSTPSLRNVHWSDLVDVTPLAPVRECPDPERHADIDPAPILDEVARLDGELHDMRTRAVKAERERDEARHGARVAFARYRELEKARQEVVDELYSLRVTAPRPLTPDAITDEMVQRLRDEERALGFAAVSSEEVARSLLAAALSEPPARPEGAEEWEDWLIETMPHESMPDEDIARLADRIAAHLTKKNGGPR